MRLESTREAANGSDLADIPDTFLTTAKQRNGEYEGTIGLWYIKGAQTFVDREGAPPPHTTIELPEYAREPGCDDE